jgi:hypothetical protein
MSRRPTALATYSTRNYRVLYEITFANMAAYCARHGYTFRPSIFTGQPTKMGASKADYLGSLLEEGFETILWMDADALVTNPEISIEDRLAGEGGLTICSDLFGLNGGVFLFDESALGQQLLYAISVISQSMGNEQAAITYLSAIEPYQGLIHVKPQRWMNSYLNEEYGRPAWWMGNWEPGDFILHLPALSLERRVELAREYSVR